MDIGIAFDLKSDFVALANPASSSTAAERPDDRLEEYDSERTIHALAAVFERRGHRVRLLGGGRKFVENLLRAPPELVFNIAEGFGSRSREAHVPAVCEMLGIRCTHSDPLTLAVALDKGMAKRVVASAGLATPRWRVVERIEELAAIDLSFPLLAKPLFEGSSMGVRKSSKSVDRAALERDVNRLLSGYGEPVLIEEFLTGPEFTVGILGNGVRARSIGVMEIVPLRGGTENFVYSLEYKREFSADVAYHVPPQRPAPFVAAVEELALAAYRTLGCRDVARIDVRVGANGQPMFIEANPLPGVNPGWSDLCVLAERAGSSYDALIGGILDAALERLGLAEPVTRAAAPRA